MTERKTLWRALAVAALVLGCPPGVVRAADVAHALVAPASPGLPAPRDTVSEERALVPEVELPETLSETAVDTTLFNQPAVEDIPLQINQDVVQWIEFFTGAGRSTFERWLKRSGRYMELFRTVLQREGLPPDLVHLVFVESGFNLNARSEAAAVGPWQFVRSSARLFGLNVNQWVDERKDPEKATVAAARYLKHLYGIFGDWPLALASYNAGEGTVLRAIKTQGTTNYWDLKLPRQTEQYVPQFMAALAITRDPVKYGFTDVEMDDPMKFDEIALSGPVDLRAIAKLADCSVEDLRELNPAVRSVAVKGSGGVTTLRVPEGRSALIQQRLAQRSLPAVNLTVRHRVRRGETLRGIADEYAVNLRELARINGISRTHSLRSGMLLTVPASLHSPAPRIIDRADDPRASTAYVPARTIGLPAQLDGNSSASDRVIHVVKRGESLYDIGQAAGVSAEQIMQWNHLRNDHLVPGQRLRVHTPEDAALADAAADSASIANLRVPVGHRRHRRGAHGAVADTPGTHVVRAGETLSQIARRHGVTVEALREANGLRDTRVRAGQRLQLPT